MKPFMNEDFLLQNTTAQRLYHEYAAAMPIIDYHCHLSPQMMAENHQFSNITEAWLYGDHYKWRAMRTNGVPEEYVTGKASDENKFLKWAETVPYTMRNPLYHWTHLELQRYFQENELLHKATAPGLYNRCSEKLNSPEFAIHGLLQKMNVKLICTTDDPLDDLRYHQQLQQSSVDLKVLPAFRPDAAMGAENTEKYNQYIDQLGRITDKDIRSFQDLLEALKDRHDYFAAQGCTVSDHGLEQMYAEDFTEAEVSKLFQRIRSGETLNRQEVVVFKSAMLYHFAIWDWEKGWVQQYHLGAIRNNNTRMLSLLGPDTGWDSIGDFSQAFALSKFLNKLDTEDKLAQTIIYNLNPADNELMATMIGNFNDGSKPGKIQWGSAWWFLDQKDGMIRQLNALSNMGLLSRFVGMLTDSRSFLSFPRHEYFRRILCNLFGEEVENGELPNDLPWIGKLVQDICYHNTRDYFGWRDLIETDRSAAAIPAIKTSL